MGSIPIVGWSGVAYYRPEGSLYQGDNCFYMPYEIDHNYAVFIVITHLALFFSSVLCLVDVQLQMRHYKSNTLFTVESHSTSAHRPQTQRSRVLQVVAGSASGHVTEFEGGHQVALAHENCRLACVVALLSYVFNHIPYTVSLSQQLSGTLLFPSGLEPVAGD